MDPVQFEELTVEIQALHKAMKNVMDIVFAMSPLLALSTHGWVSKSCHSTYFLRVSNVMFSSAVVYYALEIHHSRKQLTGNHHSSRRQRP